MVIADLKDSADEKKMSLLEIQFWKALLSGLIVEQFFQGRNKIFRKIGLVPGTKIFSKNFVSPKQNSGDRTKQYGSWKSQNLDYWLHILIMSQGPEVYLSCV